MLITYSDVIHMTEGGFESLDAPDGPWTASWLSTLLITFPAVGPRRTETLVLDPHTRGAAAVAVHQVGINHADCFHQREHGGWAHEREALFPECLGQGN